MEKQVRWNGFEESEGGEQTSIGDVPVWGTFVFNGPTVCGQAIIDAMAQALR